MKGTLGLEDFQRINRDPHEAARTRAAGARTAGRRCKSAELTIGGPVESRLWLLWTDEVGVSAKKGQACDCGDGGRIKEHSACAVPYWVLYIR